MRHTVGIVAAAAPPTAVIRATTTWQQLPVVWRRCSTVWTLVRAGDVAAGRNVMLYADDVPNVEVGVEVTAPFAPSERVVASPLPAGRAATTVVCGAPSREGLAPGHAAVVAWARAHAHELTGTVGGLRPLAR